MWCFLYNFTLNSFVTGPCRAIILIGGPGSVWMTLTGPWFAGSHQEALTKPLCVAHVLCCLVLVPTTSQRAHLKWHPKPCEHPHTEGMWPGEWLRERVGETDGAGEEGCFMTPAWSLLPALPRWYTPSCWEGESQVWLCIWDHCTLSWENADSMYTPRLVPSWVASLAPGQSHSHGCL